MAGERVLAALVLGLCLFSGVALGLEKEEKPNNYPNFEFHESPVQETPQVKPHKYDNFQFTESAREGSDGVRVANHEYKPNNYPDFKFTETPRSSDQVHSSSDNAHDQFAQGHHSSSSSSFYTVPDARDRFPASDAQNSEVFDAHQQEAGAHESFYSTDVPEYRGSDPNDRYPSSYDLINARNHANKGYSSFTSSEVRFDTHKTHVAAENRSPLLHSQSGSSRFWSPSSDPDFAFRFAKPESHTFGDNGFQADSNADKAVYSQFNFDNRDATNDPTATYGSTSPVLAHASGVTKHTPSSAASHGCANMYWAEHTKQWPSFFSVNTQVVQAFGMKAGDIYGTTTLLQALYDNRSDGYSQLLSHGTASLMNSYAMPNFSFRHDAVIDQFMGALSSRTAAGVQAQKFMNANHAYGPNECLN